MPSTSKKQAAFMRAIAHSPSFAKKAGVSQKVGKDFEMADKKKGKYAEGGTAQAERDRQKTGVKIAQVNKKMAGKETDMLKSAPKYAAGGLAKAHKAADGIAKKGKTKARMPKMAKGGGMKKGYC
jgi:hypothetical protein